MGDKPYEQLTIRDHFMFGKVCQDETNAQIILRALLNEDITVKTTEVEKFLNDTKSGKFVRLDLLAKDEFDVIYNAELQHYSNKERTEELPRRSRYYQSLIDANNIPKRKHYKDIPDVYVIFVCTYDPFGFDLPQYTFKTKCIEADIPNFDDGINRIFFNTTADLRSLPLKTQNMLKYIGTGSTSDTETKFLEDIINDARVKEIWRNEYMLTFVHDKDVYLDGYDSGYDSGSVLGAINNTISLYLKGKLKKADAMEELSLSESDFEDAVTKYQAELT